VKICSTYTAQQYASIYICSTAMTSLFLCVASARFCNSLGTISGQKSVVNLSQIGVIQDKQIAISLFLPEAT
jgi:hypothetical protein